MSSLATEGLILKRNNFGEADRVVTILTDRYGKISVIAKGVRRITSRRAGNIELLNRVKLHLFKGKNYTLTEAESLETFNNIKGNLTLTTHAFHIVELVDRLTGEGQYNRELYNLVLAILHLLERNPRQIFIRAFEIKMLALLGFWSIQAIHDLSPELKSLLGKLEYASWQQIEELQINASQAESLENILHGYIEKTIESSLKSMHVLDQLKSSTL